MNETTGINELEKITKRRDIKECCGELYSVRTVP
jgi:hypothetical protein